MQPSLTIRPTDRLAFVGKTGSGKTYAARIFTQPLARLVVIDPKGTLRGQWGLQEWSTWNAKRFQRGAALRLRVSAPLNNDYEPYFRTIYESGNATVYIDEMYGVVENARPTPFLRALYTRGRELGIGVWAATQRPAWVPLFMLSEAEWIFLFRLQMAEDRKRMASIMGDSILDATLTGHQVYVYNQSWEAPALYRSISSA